MEREKLIALVTAAQQGGEQAATDLYEAFHDDLYYHISKTVNDPVLAEDLLQDTYLEIFQTIGQLQEPAAFVTWSKQIAYHRCTAYFKKRREILADEDEDGYSAFDTIEEDRAEFIPDEALDKEDLKQTIHKMIDGLPEEQRSALLLRYFDEISVKEIAQIQGVTEGTVKSRLNYGRKAIQNAVEDYEKKNGIKLHCVGVVPLLLWLFREYAVQNGISLTAATASAAYTATTASATYTAPIVTEAVKAAGKFATKKLIAGITAAAVAAGGITAGVILANQEEPIDRNHLVGYGFAYYTSDPRHRFEMDITEMDDDSISGHLEVSFLYNTLHDSDFTGTGTEADGKIVYEISFEKTSEVHLFTEPSYLDITAVYDKETHTLSMEDYYLVTLAPVQDTPVVMENAKWSGHGVDTYYGSISPDHRLELFIPKMTETQLQGELQIFYQGKENHVSEISGRGFTYIGGMAWYEVRFHTPYTPDTISNEPIEYFWLCYNPETGDFILWGLTIQDIKLQKIS